MYLVIDIILIISIILITWLGWSTGFVRTLFPIISGFLAIFTTTKYPCQGNLSFYFIFAITVLFTIAIAIFVLKIVRFFYLNILDKICGAVLGVCIWLIVSINIVIPTIVHENHILDDRSTHSIYKTISRVMQSEVPVFENYIFKSLKKRVTLSKKVSTIKFLRYFHTSEDCK